MIGPGRPRTSHGRRPLPRASAALARLVCALVCAWVAQAPAAWAAQGLELRVAWGGGAERLWKGTIMLSEGTLSDPRPLGIEADEPGSMWIEEGQLRIEARSERAYDGVDVTVDAPLTARLIVSLVPGDSSAPGQAIEIPLSALLGELQSRPLDERNNRLLVRRTPGDTLRVRFDPNLNSLVFSPGELLKLDVKPHLMGTAAGGKVRFEMKLVSARGGQVSWSEDRELTIDDAAPATVPLEIRLPEADGVYDLQIDARVRNRLLQYQSIAERRVQLVVVAKSSPPAPLVGERSLTKVAEIDPLQPLNPNWWNRLPAIPLLPGQRKGALGTGEAHAWEHPRLREKMVQLGPGGRSPNISWEAYPLPIDRPGEPHVLEVDYPSDVPQSLGISIVEPNAAGTVLPIGLDSGVYLPDEAGEASPRWLRHRLVFWPRSRSPLVLFTNRQEGTPAVFGRIRVFGGLPRLPRAYPRESVPERLLAGYLDRPLFPENFSASESLDAWSARSLDDWQTFYEGATRLVDYLNHAGYNGLMLSAWADGSSIYPSEFSQPTPRYDTGVFFATGQDAQRKDVLELVLRLFDREGLRLAPTLQFTSPLPELEELKRRGGSESVGIEWIGADGLRRLPPTAPRRDRAPSYNPLHPRVQEAMLRMCRELLHRYGDHAAFAGLGLALSADGYAQLPDADCGFDDYTVAMFERDHPGVRVPGTGEARFAARARYFAGEQRSTWVSWRAEALGKFYQKLQAEVAQSHPGAKLYLAGAEMLGGRQTQEELRPSLPPRARLADSLLELGIKADLDRPGSGMVFLRPQRIAPVTSLAAATLAAQATNLEINQSADLDRRCQTSGTPASLFFHPPQEARLESFDAKSPFKKSFTWLVAQPAPSGESNRRRFAQALATLDAQEMFDGGWLLPLGQEAACKDLISAYRRLPAIRFETLGETSQPVVVRSATRDGRTCFYAVNDSPWNVTLRLKAAAPLGVDFEPLDPARPSGEVIRGPQGAECKLELAAYDVVGGWFSAPGVTLSQPRVELPPDVLPGLEARIRDLAARSSALSYPQPLDGLPKNHDFEQSAEGFPAFWSDAARPGAAVSVDTSQKASGAQSVRLTSTADEAWLRSEPVPPPKTGRLAISVWLRVADASRQPPLRLAAEWQAEGRSDYRYAALGRPLNGEKEEPIPESWKNFVFLVPGLPPEGVSQLRVRLDLMGPGEVWIDNVQLYDLVFDIPERAELVKLITHHTGKLQKGRVADCVRFLDSYWPRFLVAHVPLVNNPAPAGDPLRTASQPPRPVPPPAPKDDKKPGLIDRLKGMVPKRLWF